MSKWIGYETKGGLWDGPGMRLVPKAARADLVARHSKDRTTYPIVVRSIFVALAAILVMFTDLGTFAFFLVMCAGIVLVVVMVRAIIGIRPGLEERIRVSLEDRPCWGCGYSLVYLDSKRCPECGRPFDAGLYEAIDAEIAKSEEEMQP